MDIFKGWYKKSSIKDFTTKTSTITELRRLSKCRIYLIRIWGDKGVRIKVSWNSDVSISVNITSTIIPTNNKCRIFTSEQVRADLGRFKSSIDCLCDASDVLALKAKLKNKLKGKLTEKESMKYFEELVHQAEK